MPELAEWNSFYVIVGSSAGALIGLQFVVLTLISQRSQGLSTHAPEAGAAFATPSVVHFGVVLLLAAVASAPWRTTDALGVSWGLVGFGGVVYGVVVTRRMRKQSVYRPVFEDWLFHCVLPFGAYAMVAGSAYAAHSHFRPSLFVVGAATLLFLFVGIHNAWDAVTYHVFAKREDQPQEDEERR